MGNTHPRAILKNHPKVFPFDVYRRSVAFASGMASLYQAATVMITIDSTA